MNSLSEPQHSKTSLEDAIETVKDRVSPTKVRALNTEKHDRIF